MRLVFLMTSSLAEILISISFNSSLLTLKAAFKSVALLSFSSMKLEISLYSFFFFSRIFSCSTRSCVDNFSSSKETLSSSLFFSKIPAKTSYFRSIREILSLIVLSEILNESHSLIEEFNEDNLFPDSSKRLETNSN